MSRTNYQAEIVSEEQLVPRANRLVIKKNNQRIASDSHITDTMLRFVVEILRHHKLYKSDSKLHSSQDDHPITKLLSITNGEYKFRMEVPDAMISYAIKKKAGYKYYIAKKVESEIAIIVDKPEEQHVSPIKSGRGKGFMCYGDQVSNVPNKLKKDVVPRKTRSLTIAEEAVIDLRKGSKASRLESLRQKKQPVAGEGSSAAHNKYYSSSDTDSDTTLYSSSSDKPEGSANETDDVDESDMDLSNDNPNGDDDAAKYEVFMHNKSTATPNSTYLSPMVTSSLLDFIQTMPNETPKNELTDFMSHPVYTGAQSTSVVHSPEGNPELTSYISGAFEVSLGTHVDVLATKSLMQEMFLDENAHHILSPPSKKIPYHTTTLQPNSLQAKAKKLMQKAKKNLKKINFKKAFAQKFREYDQKLEALTNFNVFEAFEKAVQAKVLTEIKKLLTTHILNAIANYVKPRLNTSMLEDGNHILGPLIIAIAKKFKEPIQKDELTIADLEGARLERLKWNSDEGDVSKPKSFERHMSKSTKPHPCFYNNDYTYLVDLSTKEKYTTSITKHYVARYYKEGIEDGIPKRWSKEVCRYHFEALNGIHHWEEDRIDFFKAGMSTVTEGNVYSNLRIKSVVRIVVKKKCSYGLLTSIVVRRFDDQEYEFSYVDLPRLSVNDVEDMYLLQVQDKLHHLPLEFVKDFNNALLMFIRRTMIKNRVEYIHL
ncbi:hypothetical protein Tco_1001053 [Tanacetum coccineum]